MGTSPVLFTAREAADALDVAARTINRWVAERRIRPCRTIRVGRYEAALFTEAEVERVRAARAPGVPPVYEDVPLPLGASA